jgi:hypothetical protein
MTFSDNCLATLGSGITIWMKAFSSAETVVSYSEAEKECNEVAASHAYSAPEIFYFEGGRVLAPDVLKAAGDYIFKGNGDIEFHYTKVGAADFRLGDETGAMTCTTKTNGEPHSY